MYDTQTPYVASYVLLREGDTVAFVLRSNTGWMNGYYGLYSGKVEKDESFQKAAIREAKEEVGVDVKEQDLSHALTVHRYSSDNTTAWVDIYFEVKEWEGEVVNAEPHVHSEVAWLELKNLPANVIPSVKAALEAIARGDVYSEYGWEETR